MKCCTVCKQEKPLEDFYNLKAAKDGKSWRCKTCDRETTMNSRKLRYEKSREQARIVQRKWKYGLTDQEFKALLESQGSKCKCCGTELFDGWGRNHARNKLVVDHCHETNKVRGLICTMCNKGLGLLGDNSEGLYKAYEYLKNFENSEVH